MSEQIPSEEMTDTEMWREIRRQTQWKREMNRENAWEVLRRCGVEYEFKNHGAHLIVCHGGKVVDYWPGTGSWIDRAEQKKHFGIERLAKHIGVDLRWKRSREVQGP